MATRTSHGGCIVSLYLGQPHRLVDDPRRIVLDVVLDTDYPCNVAWVAQLSPDPWAAYRAVRDAAAMTHLEVMHNERLR